MDVFKQKDNTENVNNTHETPLEILSEDKIIRQELSKGFFPPLRADTLSRQREGKGVRFHKSLQ